MPYKRRNGFEPLTPNTVLWRYLDFTKFVDLLFTKELHLARVDDLGDTFEGWFPDAQKPKRRGFFDDQWMRRHAELRGQSERLRQCYFASCWHANEHESDAMWKVYVKGEEGPAIRTTFRRLRDAIKDEPRILVIAPVQYRDYHAPPQLVDNMLRACMTKRKCFEHEREVRVIWEDKAAIDTIDTTTEASDCAASRRTGIKVACDVDTLIEKVLIASTKGRWLEPVVQDVLKKYGVKAGVGELDLTSEPTWGR